MKKIKTRVRAKSWKNLTRPVTSVWSCECLCESSQKAHGSSVFT